MKDNSQIAVDYHEQEGRSSSRLTCAYATINRIFVHHLFPGGPSRVVLDCTWFDVLGLSPKSGNVVVVRNEVNSFNLNARMTFIKAAYRRPVAVWTYDPLESMGAPHTSHYEIIDRNENERPPHVREDLPVMCPYIGANIVRGKCNCSCHA